jgi:DNA-binding CsgD family transcriptional regulator
MSLHLRRDQVLAPDDRQAVLASLGVIGQADGITDFAERVCRELLRLVPGISSSYNEVNLPAQRIAGLVNPDKGRDWFEQYTGILEANLRDSPIVRYFEEGGETDIVSWSDLDPDGSFFDSVLYREFYAQNGVRSQIAFLLPAPPGIHVGLVINRDGTEFSPRERAMLAELRPHLVNLYRLVSHAEASRHRDAALAADGWSVVLVDDDGTVLESNPAAEAIGRTAGVDLAAGARLRDGPFWPAPRGSAEGPGTSTATAPAPSADSSGDASLVRSGDTALQASLEWTRATPYEVRLVRSLVGPHVLWIREPNRVTVQDAVALGLTARQAEVAILLVDGLSNEQIAERLFISTGTVRAHLDEVFRRLGVSSRAAVVGRLQTGRPVLRPQRT